MAPTKLWCSSHRWEPDTRVRQRARVVRCTKLTPTNNASQVLRGQRGEQLLEEHEYWTRASKTINSGSDPLIAHTRGCTAYYLSFQPSLQTFLTWGPQLSWASVITVNAASSVLHLGQDFPGLPSQNTSLAQASDHINQLRSTTHLMCSVIRVRKWTMIFPINTIKRNICFYFVSTFYFVPSFSFLYLPSLLQ